MRLLVFLIRKLVLLLSRLPSHRDWIVFRPPPDKLIDGKLYIEILSGVILGRYHTKNEAEDAAYKLKQFVYVVSPDHVLNPVLPLRISEADNNYNLMAYQLVQRQATG